MKKSITTGLFALSTCIAINLPGIAYADEMAERYALKMKVRSLYQQQDFKSLNSMYMDALNNKTKTASGTLLLWHYYQAFNSYYNTLYADQTQAWKQAEQGLAQWQQQYPDSAAPKILRARLLAGKSEAYFDNRFLHPEKADCDTKLPMLDQIQAKLFSLIPTPPEADTPSFIGMSCGFAYRDTAREYLKQMSPDVQRDPEWFVTQMEIYSEDPDDAKCSKAFYEGIKKHPGYYNIYFHGVTCHFSNDRQKRMQMRDYIARLAAANTKATEGDALYSRVYWVIESYCCRKNLRKESMVDWPRMQKSMEQVLNKYPTQWNYANFAAIACLAEDQQLTRKLFLSIPRYNANDWEDTETYERCKKFAAGS